MNILCSFTLTADRLKTIYLKIMAVKLNSGQAIVEYVMCITLALVAMAGLYLLMERSFDRAWEILCDWFRLPSP